MITPVFPRPLCIIPARSGSKRIPRKNIRLFHGQPMLAWSIQAAIYSGIFDQVIVSTDCPEIASIAQAYGAEVPFLRPPSLADDYATTHDVVVHAINALRDQDRNPGVVCCLYATAPMVRPKDLCDSLNMLAKTWASSYVFAATSYAFPIQRSVLLDDQNVASLVFPEHVHTRSQDLEQAYHDAGQFYWARPETWLSRRNVFDGGIALVLPRWRVIDIDTEEDWKLAELLYHSYQTLDKN